jgi:hypothetical protein
MNVDSSYTKGKAHHVCQDYARAGTVDGFPYAVVSDGCSGSPDSDVGARILTLCAENYIKADKDPLSPKNLLPIAFSAQAAMAAFKLSEMALDATLLIAKAREGVIDILVRGDGFVIQKRKDGSFAVAQMVFESGYPDYLNYELNPLRAKSIKDKTPGIVRFCEFEKDFKPRSVANPTIMQLAVASAPFCYHAQVQTKDTEWLALSTDGLASFAQDKDSETSKDTTPVPYEQVIEKLLAFKGFQGCFVQRRLQKFMKDCSTFKWANMDDVSLGVVSCGDLK